MLSYGTISWSQSGDSNFSPSTTDYTGGDKKPTLGTSSSLSDEGISDTGYSTSGAVYTNTILSNKIPKSIVVYGKTDQPTNTDITVDVSQDGGSTWDITDQEINAYIDTSSFTTPNLALKFNLSTTDSSSTPKLYGYGVAIT